MTKKIYVISKYAGDVEKNVSNAITYCRHVINQGHMPIAVHLLYPQIMDDDIPAERELGMSFGIELLEMCDEAWVFGEDCSEGMKKEITRAAELKKRIRYIADMSEEAVSHPEIAMYLTEDGWKKNGIIQHDSERYVLYEKDGKTVEIPVRGGELMIFALRSAAEYKGITVEKLIREIKK